MADKRLSVEEISKILNEEISVSDFSNNVEVEDSEEDSDDEGEVDFVENNVQRSDEDEYNSDDSSMSTQQNYFNAPSISDDNIQPASSNIITLLSTTDIHLYNSLQQFWKLEEPPLSVVAKQDEKLCENHFRKMRTRDRTGRHKPDIDAFPYKIDLVQQVPTKRLVLSAVAQIYKPCGWLTPLVLWAKSLMQLLWTLGLSWDESLPADISARWRFVAYLLRFIRNLKNGDLVVIRDSG
uniref:Uncharacterized protein n=1 Tax=Timema bartmani TaxID=61472 RepID=A0A7R9F552_9NEOP|nr:unnamed protein product [Timema bartmani]